MPAYCDVDGVPCHASTELLAGILRGEWGFDGFVASDYMGVEMVALAHQPHAGARRGRRGWRSRQALMPSCRRTAAFGAPLVAALEAGRVDEAQLDEPSHESCG